MSHKIVPL